MDPAAEVVLGQPLVVEDRAELVDEVVVDLLAQLVEHRVPALGAAAAAGALLHLVKALVERHHPPSPFGLCVSAADDCASSAATNMSASCSMRLGHARLRGVEHDRGALVDRLRHDDVARDERTRP